MVTSSVEKSSDSTDVEIEVRFARCALTGTLRCACSVFGRAVHKPDWAGCHLRSCRGLPSSRV